MKTRICLIIAACALLTGCAKLVVVPLKTNEKIDSEGVFYALPKTFVRVGLKVDQTTIKPAPYIKYAAIFAPGGDAVCKVAKEAKKCSADDLKTKFELQQGATFVPVGEPDPKKVFMVKFVGGGAIDQTMSMAWNEAGLLSTASASVTNRTGDVIISGLKLAANIGTKAVFAATKKDSAGNDTDDCPETTSNDAWIVPILKEKTKDLIVNYCNIPEEDRKNNFDKDTDKDLLIIATIAYKNNQIDTLLSAKFSHLTGGSQTYEPLELSNKLDSLINDRLSALYLGSKKTITWDGLIDVRNINTSTETSIIRIDPSKGICIENAELSPGSKPFPDKFKILTECDCKSAQPVSVKFRYYPDEASQLYKNVEKSINDPTGDRSFSYTIPAQVMAELKFAGSTYGTGIFSVAQLGKDVSLPAERFSKTISYDLAFIEATGGLKSFKLGSTGAIDASAIDSLSGVGGNILDARNAARKAENAANSEATILTNDVNILKLKSDKCKYLKEFGRECTEQP